MSDAVSVVPAAGFDEARLLGRGAPTLDLAASTLPPPLRPEAGFGVLDISEYFAETSGGVRTYLLQKARYVEARPALRQVLVLPGAEDRIGALTGVRCYRLHGPLIPLQSTYRFMLATRSMARICAHERPDLIEVGSAYTVPWLVARATDALRVPAVWFYHAHLPRILNPLGHRGDALRRAVAGLAGGYVRAITRTVERTIVSSDFVVRDLAALGITRVSKVPLGVDVALFHPGRAARRAEIRARHGLPDGPLAIYLGRLSFEKHVHILLRAWQDVAHRTGAMLAVVGSGRDERRFRLMAGPNVTFVPFQTDRDAVADLYAAADFAVSPCPVETFGLAALEAMASGVPVLAADSGGVAETVGNSGAGMLFEGGNAESLSAAAQALLAADLPALGRIGRAYVERQHRWDHVFDQLFAVYRDVLGR